MPSPATKPAAASSNPLKDAVFPGDDHDSLQIAELEKTGKISGDNTPAPIPQSLRVGDKLPD